MVYIKLNNNLYEKLKPYTDPAKFVNCQKQYYLAYPQLKKIAKKHKLEIHKEIKKQDIISYNDMDILIERQKQNPEQAKLIEELRNKRQLRMLNRINPKSNKADYYFQKEGENNGVKQMSDTISFSMAFIFSFFMAGLTGYYFGAYFLGWSLAHSLMIALAFIILTILIETTLFILKQSKTKQKSTKHKYRYEYDKGVDAQTSKEGLKQKND